MEKTGWKTLGIVFLIVTIVETIFIVWLFWAGYQVLEEENNAILRENVCIVEICADFSAYWYDDTTQVCECYENGVLAYQEVVKNA